MVDEIGFVPLHKEAAELLFQVISNCYERRSLIITSNLEFSQWNTVFGDNRLAAALIDRFIHHSHIGIFSGESYRLAQSMNRLARYPVRRPEWPATARFGASAPDACAPVLPAGGRPSRQMIQLTIFQIRWLVQVNAHNIPLVECNFE